MVSGGGLSIFNDLGRQQRLCIINLQRPGSQVNFKDYNRNYTKSFSWESEADGQKNVVKFRSN